MKKLFFTIKLLVKQIKAAMRIQKGQIDITEKTLDGFKYYYCPDLVVSNGALAALTTKNILGINLIIVDEYFEKMTDSTKMFILCHELGHQMNGDTDISVKESKKEMKMRTKKNYLSERELKADAYAYSIVGKENSIKALEELIELLQSLGASTLEVERRLEAIRNK